MKHNLLKSSIIALIFGVSSLANAATTTTTHEIIDVTVGQAKNSKTSITDEFTTKLTSSDTVYNATKENVTSTFTTTYLNLPKASGKAFDDVLNFTLGKAATFNSSISEIYNGTPASIKNADTSFTAELKGGSISSPIDIVFTKTFNSITGRELWTYNSGTTLLKAGNYSIDFTGTTKGTVNSFAATNTFVTAVPEPEEWAMMMLGLPLMGLVAKRRKSSAAVITA